MTPRNILTKSGRAVVLVTAAWATAWSWSCVILEVYCATQSQQGYNACMKAADPAGRCFCM
jgi:hypothetical protein